MDIGIIGAGMIGGTLARRLSQLNYNVTIANSRGLETLKDLAAEINVKTGTAYCKFRFILTPHSGTS